MHAILSVHLKPSQVTMTIVLAAMTGLGTDVGHLPMNPILCMQNAIVDFAKNVDSLLQTMAIESDG